MDKGPNKPVLSARGSGKKQENAYWSPFITDIEVEEEKPVLIKKFNPMDRVKEQQNLQKKSLDQKMASALKVHVAKGVIGYPGVTQKFVSEESFSSPNNKSIDDKKKSMKIN